MKYTSLPALLVIGLMLWLSLYQPVRAQTPSPFCGVENLTPAQAQELQKQANLALQRKRASGAAFTAITYVPIRPHIIRRSDGTGGLTLAGMNQMLAYTNSHYLLNGFGIQFYFAGTTPDYIDSDQLYAGFPYGEGSLVDGRDATNAMNQYYVHLFTANVAGYAYFPYDGIGSTRSFIEIGDGSQPVIVGNRTVAHELGHNFNLLHTHGPSNDVPTDELVTRGAGANCSSAGDQICDTPADPYYVSGVSTIDVNGCTQYNPNNAARDANGDPYTPMVTNIMGYWANYCVFDFTPGQFDRIQAGLALRQNHTSYTLNAPATNVTPISNLTATSNGSSVTLTWQDNASNEMGYFIERSISPTTGFLPIGGVAPNVATFTDTKVIVDTQYYYRIRPSNTTNGSLSPTITVVAAFPLVTGLTTTSVTGTSAQLNWNSLGTGITYEGQWRAVGSTTWNTFTDWGATTCPLYGLTINTTYEWQVRATHTNTYANPVNFTTTCPTPTLYSPFPTRTTATLSWSGIFPQTFTLQWRSQGSPGWITVDTQTSSYYSLTGLTSSTVYEWQVQATCPGSTTAVSTYSSPQSFTTLYCQSPTSLYTNNVYSTAASLSWNAPYQTSIGYNLQYRPVGSPTWTPVNSLTTTYYSLTGLTSNTPYEWKVQSVCDIAESSTFTSPSTFTTVCRVPTTLFSIPTASAATLSWGLSYPLEPSATFEVQYRVTGSPGWTTVGSISYGYSLTGLASSTTYEWRVRTICNANNQSDYSATNTFSTDCYAPVAGNLFTSLLTSTSVQFHWYLNAEPGTHYDLRYRPTGASDWTTISSLTATIPSGYYSVGGLTNNTAYEWQIRTVCSATQSSTFTPGPTFTTQCRTPDGLNNTGRVTSAILYWTGTGTDVSYEVRYRKLGTTDWTVLSNQPTISVTISGLTTGTGYEWQVRTQCSDGVYSDFSYLSTFYTSYCSSPYGLSGMGLTATTAALQWYFYGASTDTKFEGRYRAIGAPDWIPIPNLPGLNNYSVGYFVLTGLTSGIQYEWQVKTICSPTESSDFSSSGFFTVCASMYTTRAGFWNDASIWSCNRVPINSDIVQIKHQVTIPSGYVATAKGLSFDAGKTVSYGTNSQLKLGL